jgi:hypothetical protein
VINSIEDLRSGGALPTGPCSAWPKERNIAGMALQAAKNKYAKRSEPAHDTEVKTNIGQMAKGFIQTAKQAVVSGKVSREIRQERYETCKACPHFIEESKRCSECGCFMEAKTWVAGPPKMLCPKDKWSR